MFERFTERAREVVVYAQDEARRLEHNYIGTEHILLGLLRDDEGLAARVLESFDVTVEGVRAQVARIVGQGDESPRGQIPFTPRTKKVLELSLREAISLGHNYIGTEHILLGLVREGEGVAMRILLDDGVDAERVRNELFRMLAGRVPPPRPAAEYRPSEIFVPEFEEDLDRLPDEKAAALREAAAELDRVWRRREVEVREPIGVGPEDLPPSSFASGPLLAAVAAVGIAIGVAVGWAVWG